MQKVNLECNLGKVDEFWFLVQSPIDLIQSYWDNNRWYEENMVEFIKKNYTKGGTYLDVGACNGNYSVLFSKLADKVYSFEPNE